ncbi:MAG: CDP-alcohol phosphatidyltransferase family protein [Gemmatimonadaceae bacterium]|nr:CDP-alcohol phosphatidyltransferase family protein [Gemmatimonadaceae bacterium]
MKALWSALTNVYLRIISPIADLLVRTGVSPNTLTTVGTLCTLGGSVAYGMGHIKTGGWIIGITAIFDVLDGTVARKSGKSTVFGAFYDSTLDRVADGGVLLGLAYFFATSPVHQSLRMVVICFLCLIGTYLISYTRARAEALGIDAKVGIMQRPERVILLCAPQALFGLALGGLVLKGIVILLTVTAWWTAIHRILFVRRVTLHPVASPLRVVTDLPKQSTIAASRRAQS